MIIRQLGIQPYISVLDDMKKFTSERDANTSDEIWMLEHFPVYTQGQAGKSEHILNPNDIPVIQSDRGGQVTYHGPGQLVVYCLINIAKMQLGVRTLVCKLEQTIINMLKTYQINAERLDKAPGVYVDNKKIASIGLRVKNGCTYHGIAINIALDLKPFAGINPCGYKNMQVTQVKDFYSLINMDDAKKQFIESFLEVFKD